MDLPYDGGNKKQTLTSFKTSEIVQQCSQGKKSQIQGFVCNDMYQLAS